MSLSLSLYLFLIALNNLSLRQCIFVHTNKKPLYVYISIELASREWGERSEAKEKAAAASITAQQNSQMPTSGKSGSKHFAKKGAA